MNELEFLNKVAAWLTAGLMVYMFIPFSYLKWNWLKKAHSVVGIALIPITIWHCRLAEQATGKNSFLGGILLLLLLVQGFTSMIRKSLGKRWIKLHRLISLLLMVLVLIHIVYSVITP